MKHFTILIALLAFLLSASSFAQLDTRTSTSAGVTVKVTPKVLDANAGAWEFAIVLDTHSQELSDDLIKTAVIVNAAGERYSPFAWEGAGPGGHHREGVLKFQAIKPAPRNVELRIHRAGESAPRVFRWELN